MNCMPSLTLPEILKRYAKDKDVLYQLTIPQLKMVMDHLRSPDAARGNIPDNPSDFATHFKLLTDQGTPWESAPHLDKLSGWLAETAAGKRRHIIITMPPRHGKSLLVSYVFPLWVMARDPHARVIVASYEHEFAAFWGQAVRETIRERGEEWGLELDRSTTARHNWKLKSGGSMRTAGTGGPLTGKGADFLIIDDPIKDYEEASSEVMREKAWQWFMSTAYTRVEPKTGVCIVLHTRWFQDDLIGRLIAHSENIKEERAKGNPVEGPVWDVFNLPMIAEEHDALGRAPGEVLWPGRFPPEDVSRIRGMTSPYQWSALYQQRPSPEEGGAVKRAWWKFYKQLPADYDVMIQTWDLAFHDLKKSDYSVGQVWARRGAQYFLVDQVRGHFSMPEVISAARALTAKYPKATAKLVEDRANGPALIQMLHREIAGIIPVPAKGSKDARLQKVIPAIEAGNVFLPQNPDDTRAKWVWEFIEECAGFPNVAHDDQLDAMVHGLGFLLNQGWTSVQGEWSEALIGPPPADLVELRGRILKKKLSKELKKGDRKFNKSRSYLTQKIKGPRIW